MCEQTQAQPHQILYREIIGAGDDNEHSIFGSGIIVTLSYWHSDDGWKAPSHYLLERKVMLDRQISVDDIQVFRAFIAKHDKYIRRAIAEIDQLKELNMDIMEEAARS
jgi:hypothetical protein